MRHIARLVPAIAFIIGLFVAIRQLASQNAQVGNVVLTGAYVIGGVILLFVAIVGAGKGLGKLVNRHDREDDDSHR